MSSSSSGRSTCCDYSRHSLCLAKTFRPTEPDHMRFDDQYRSAYELVPKEAQVPDGGGKAGSLNFIQRGKERAAGFRGGKTMSLDCAFVTDGSLRQMCQAVCQ